MTLLQYQIEAFFEFHGYEYTNSIGAEVIFDPEDTSLIQARFPGFPLENSHELFVCVNCTFADMIRLFDIMRVEDLERINVDRIMQLYLQGKGEVFCILDNDQNQTYYFNQGVMWAKDDCDRQHEVPDQLVTADDFIAYTAKTARKFTR